MLTDSLQVQTGSKYNVSLDASYSCKESDRILRVLFVLDFISLVSYQDVFICIVEIVKKGYVLFSFAARMLT